jgi:HAD superfamily hydrolase (TIGR01490 family)
MSRPAAIFDLDGTLLAGTSAERLFLRRALGTGALRWRSMAPAAARTLVFWAQGADLFAASKSYLHGHACAPLEQLGVTVVDSDLWPRLRGSMLTALDEHRKRGDAIVLLSGTLDFLGTEVARRLRAEFVACARLGRRDGVFTGRVLPPFPHGAGKLAVLLALAKQADLDLVASHAYANTGSDAVHLGRVGFAHAVAPNRSLRRVARARGWSIHDDTRAATDDATPRHGG